MHVTVPDFEGLSIEEAEAAAAQAGIGLDPSVQWRPKLDQEFQVVDVQSPSAGESVWRGTTVLLAMRAAEVNVPNVAGNSLSQAKDILERAGLLPAPDYDSESAQEFIVESQGIPAGKKVKAGQQIRLLLHLPEIPVPDVTGLSRDVAQKKLTDAGFVVDLKNLATITEEWTAENTSPSAGTPATYGTQVVVNYLGPLINVPDVMGKAPSAAKSTLESAGFVVQTDPSTPAYNGFVSSQSVAAGEQARKGSTITLTISGPTVEYLVTGNGSSASVTWSPPGSSFDISQETSASLPWSKSWPTDSRGYGGLNAQLMSGTEITCEIKVNGKVVKTNTSTGRYAVVSCQ